jgi:hypothetical protein
MPPTEAGDRALLRRALELAAMGSPRDVNPRVGAVFTNTDGAVVGEGYHRGAGTPHAEIEALRAAGPAARGGTAYVSLELKTLRICDRGHQRRSAVSGCLPKKSDTKEQLARTVRPPRARMSSNAPSTS